MADNNGLFGDSWHPGQLFETWSDNRTTRVVSRYENDKTLGDQEAILLKGAGEALGGVIGKGGEVITGVLSTPAGSAIGQMAASKLLGVPVPSAPAAPIIMPTSAPSRGGGGKKNGGSNTTLILGGLGLAAVVLMSNKKDDKAK